MARWTTLLCATLVCAQALDSNKINWYREPSSNHTVSSSDSLPEQVETSQNAARRRSCSDCNVPVRSSCSRRTPQEEDSADSRTGAPEMSSCIRTSDCADGLCCVRYLTGRRCQRIPGKGEACLLRGSAKIRRKIGRCNCSTGLTCQASGRTVPGRVKGQGVCTPHKQGQHKTRNSRKQKRTTEDGC